MAKRVSEATRLLHGTAHKARPPRRAASLGTPRIERMIAPPDDMPPELTAQWDAHMQLVVTTGRAAMCDLIAFHELVNSAHMCEVAREEARQTGPTDRGQKGEVKVSAAWRAWLAASQDYRHWLSHFGLTPRSRGTLAQLPAQQAGELRVVGRGA